MMFEYKVLKFGVGEPQVQEDELNRWAVQGWMLDRVAEVVGGVILFLYLRREVQRI